MNTLSHLHVKLKEVGLSPRDLVMVHGDSAIFESISRNEKPKSSHEFIHEFLEYFNVGTVLIPTFTYSATRSEVFDVENTPSEIGLFSEIFRTHPNARRTSHPIFSFVIFGKNTEKFLDAAIDDCFGVNSIFDIFLKNSGKLVCMGCSINRLTFVHYVEQTMGVSYRHLKVFKGDVKKENNIISKSVKYFVRDLSINSSTDLKAFKTQAIAENKLRVTKLGRLPVWTISAGDFFSVATKLITQDEYSLISQSRFDA